MKKNVTAKQISFKQTLLTSLVVAAGVLTFSNNSHAHGAEACATKTWAMGNTYKLNDVVSSRGHNYKIIQPHTAYAGNWNPENAPALWKDLGACGPNASNKNVNVTHKTSTGKPEKKVNKPAVEFGKSTPPSQTASNNGPSSSPAQGSSTGSTYTPPPSNANNNIQPKSDTGSFPISEAQFNQMYPNRHEVYTYDGLVAAYSRFKEFLAVGDDATKKRELAAFLANVGHETGDLVYAEQIEKGDYCDSGNRQYPCAPGKKYYGRGPIQIGWNYNYGILGDILGLPLLSDPDLVVDVRRGGQVTSWFTGVWFWMTSTGAGNMTPHDAMVNNRGFGETIRAINGALECNGRSPDGVNSRVQRYLRFTSMMGVDPGGNIYC